ncbi:MAG: PAS domain-containing protein [Cytophagaceae bacterium]|nr:PAS domain-containing protein [Cytophagaceae bacterium]
MSTAEVRNKVVVKEKSAQRLTRLYIIALSMVAILTIAGQFIIQKSIKDQLSDSRVVNFSGRQRYQSQEITKLCLLVRDTLPISTYKDIRKSILQLTAEWELRHLALQYGNDSLKIPKNSSLPIADLFTEADPYFYIVYNNARTIALLDSKDSLYVKRLNVAIENVLSNEKLFLDIMNKIVFRFDFEAREKVAWLEKIEYILFILTLVVLLFEGFFIFRPASKTIEQNIEELIDAEQQAMTLAQKLRVSNTSLSKSLKELKDVTFALEHATVMIRTDPQGIITYTSEKFCSILKYDAEDLVGKSLEVLNSHYHSQQFFDDLWKTISRGDIWNDEIRNKAKDGSYVWLDTTIIPVYNEYNAIGQYIAIYTDLTEKFKHSISEQKIRTASVLEGQEKERRKIARELHDGLGQMLTALRFNIQAIPETIEKEENGLVKTIKQSITEIIQEVRRISFDLMPSVLHDFGLSAGLHHLCERMNANSTAVEIHYIGTDNTFRLDKNFEINLYRIAQEAMNNAIKYAEPNKIEMDLQLSSKQLVLVIQDDGNGFIPSDKKKIDGSGRGLTNIKERVNLLNGNLIFNSIIGEGTTVRVEVPLTQKI